MSTDERTAGKSETAGIGITADEFKRAFRHHPGGVAVVTADAGGGPVAATLSSLASVSAEPPILIFSLSDMSSSSSTILQAGSFVAHLLDAGEIGIGKLAATHGAERFVEGSWDRYPSGEPYYLGVRNRLRCQIVDTVRAGTSTIVVGLVLEAAAIGDDVATPLVYVNRAWHQLGPESEVA